MLKIGSGKTVVDTLGYGEVAEPNNLTNSEKIAGYVNVLDYGAKADDDIDDTEAFEKAIKKNIAVYVPAGKYIVSRPLPFNDQNFFGDGAKATIITSVMIDATKPIVYLGGSSTLSDMTLEYASELITGQEVSGERIAVRCGAAVGFGPGGGIRDAVLQNIGTAVLSDATDGYGTSNCSFERIEVMQFTNSAFDFTCASGYGNIFKQITIKDAKANAAFVFAGVGGTDLIESAAIKNCELSYAVGYTELAGVTVSNISYSDCNFTKEKICKIEALE